MMISAQKINITKNKRHILQDVSLDIEENSFITILGPNGAGKSLLLKIICGIEKPDSGKLIKPKNTKIGYVPQKMDINNLIPMTVKYFLSINKKLDDSIIEETSINDIMDKQIHQLSGGQLQRVLVARALLGSPNLLILDEPAQNLDLSGQLSFYKLLNNIYKSRKIAILMVSHDLHMVMASTQKVFCLFGHICCSGTPQMVAKDPEFISLFGKDMAKMMAVYNHTHNHSHN